MIIDDFDVEGVAVMPFKADTPLLVYADGILPLPVTAKSVKPVSRIQHQSLQAWGSMQDHQPLSRLPLERLESPNSSVLKKFLSIPAGKRFYHTRRVLRLA
jgi:hypothetical protein